MGVQTAVGPTPALNEKHDSSGADGKHDNRDSDSKTGEAEEGQQKLLPSPSRVITDQATIPDLRPKTIEQASSTLYQYGCCILQCSLPTSELEEWHRDMIQLPVEQLTERNPIDGSRFTYGGHKALPHWRYKRLEMDPMLLALCNRVLRPGWAYGKHTGDVVVKRSFSSQELHSDWPNYDTDSREFGYALVVSLAVHDIETDQAAIRIMPWCNPGYDRLPYQNSSSGRLCGFQIPMTQGEMLVRDCRMAHSGMPNYTGHDRVLPGIQINTMEFFASWEGPCWSDPSLISSSYTAGGETPGPWEL